MQLASEEVGYIRKKEIERIETWRMIECMWEDGLTTQEIADELKTTHAAVTQKIYVMRKAGWPIHYRHRTSD